MSASPKRDRRGTFRDAPDDFYRLYTLYISEYPIAECVES